jgi:hypothetical protein
MNINNEILSKLGNYYNLKAIISSSKSNAQI